MNQDVKLPVRKTKTCVQGGWTALFVFLFFFVIMLCAPKSYDDFEFARVAGGSFQDMVSFALTYGNGRLLGNLGGVLLQTSIVLAAFVKAAVMTGLVYLVPGVLGIRSGAAVAVAFLMFAGMEPEEFAQVLTWTSGFQNFIPPVFLSLLALYLMQKYPAEPGKTGEKALILVAVGLLGVAGQLYGEHSVIVHLALAVVVLAKTIKDRQHRGLAAAIVFLLAVFAGTGAHLLIPKLFVQGSSHVTTYRAIHLGSLKDMLFCSVRNFLRLCNQYCGLLGLPLCAGAWLAGKATAHRRSGKANCWQQALSVLPAGYMLFSTLMDANGWYGELALVQEAVGVAAVLLPLGAWIWALFSQEDALYRDCQLTLLLFAMFALAPLLVVHPIGYRVQFHSYVFVLLACFHSSQKLVPTWKPEARTAGKRAAQALCLLLALCMGMIFGTIRSLDKARDTHIRQQLAQGAEEIFVFRFPMDYVYNDRDPMLGEYYYRDTPMDTQFPLLTFDIWQDQYVK